MSQNQSKRIEPGRRGFGRGLLSLLAALVLVVAAGITFVQLSSRGDDATTNRADRGNQSKAARELAEARSQRETPATSAAAASRKSSPASQGQAGTLPAATSAASRNAMPDTAASADVVDAVDATDAVATSKTNNQVASNTGSAPTTYAEAEQLYQDGEYDLAAVGFASYLESHPRNIWGHYMLGLSHWKTGDFPAAERSLLAALDLGPDHVKSLTNLARVRLDQGNFADAILPIERAAERSPDSGEVQRVYARCLHAAGRPADAAHAYARALAIDPHDVWSLNNLGLLWIEREEFSLALPPLAKAAELRPELATVQNNLGIALERTGCFRAATESYERAFEADSNYAKAIVNSSRSEALIVTQSVPDPDLSELALSFDPKKDLAALPTSPAGTRSQATSVGVADEGTAGASSGTSVALSQVGAKVNASVPIRD